MRRVVITGMGAITPVGLSVEEFWNSVKEGKTNFAEVTRFDSQITERIWQQRSTILIQRIIWISNLQNVWSFSASMR